MSQTYLLTYSSGRVIINIEQSKIGYSYPRIFLELNTGDYVNIDVTLGVPFKMSKEDFESWLDGSEITDKSLKDICAMAGLAYVATRYTISDVLKVNIDMIE